MQLIGRRSGATDVAAASDAVIANYPVPQDGKLNYVHLEVHVIGAEGMLINQASWYGISGFMVPLGDADLADSVDDLWDLNVPKDVNLAEGVWDMDEATVDATPEFEIGTPDVHALLDMQPGEVLEIFRRRQMLSLARGGFFKDVLAATDEVVVTDYMKTKISRGVNVNEPTMCLFGLSSPDTLATTTTIPTAPTEVQWVLLKYLEIALEQAFMAIVGLIEAAADEPYATSMAFIAGLVEETVFEEAAASYLSQSWRVFTNATFSITVPGSVDIGTVTSE